MTEISSPYYPYDKVQPGSLCMRGAEEIPRKIVQYLMDMPLRGYKAPDDNSYPRCRLMKYLFYDDADALIHPVPTTAEKLSILYDPENPTSPPTDKGYRIFPQSYVGQSQLNAQTRLMVYIGQLRAVSEYRREISVVFDILTNVTSESNATALSRVWAMECAIHDALNGVNIDGVGAMYCNRQANSECGSIPIGDRGTNVGRSLCMSLCWQ